MSEMTLATFLNILHKNKDKGLLRIYVFSALCWFLPIVHCLSDGVYWNRYDKKG